MAATNDESARLSAATCQVRQWGGDGFLAIPVCEALSAQTVWITNLTSPFPPSQAFVNAHCLGRNDAAFEPAELRDLAEGVARLDPSAAVKWVEGGRGCTRR